MSCVWCAPEIRSLCSTVRTSDLSRHRSGVIRPQRLRDQAGQTRRILCRHTPPDQFRRILDAQMPDAEKRGRADFVIETDTPEHAREQVARIVTKIRKELADA